MGFLGPQQDIGDQLNLKRTPMSNFEAEYGKFATSVCALPLRTHTRARGRDCSDFLGGHRRRASLPLATVAADNRSLSGRSQKGEALHARLIVTSWATHRSVTDLKACPPQCAAHVVSTDPRRAACAQLP